MNKPVSHALLIIFSLLCSLVSNAEIHSSFNSAQVNAKIISLPMNFVERFPAKLEGMPRVKATETWPNSKAGDEIYDISEWFEKEMNKNRKRGKQWVYYNNSSKRIVANADLFLREYLHSYIKKGLISSFTNIRIIYDYIEVPDNTPLTFDAIANIDYKLLHKGSFSASNVGQSYSDGKYKISIGCHRLDPDRVRAGTAGIEIGISNGEKKLLDLYLVLVPGNRLIKEVGISKAGRKKLLVIHTSITSLDGVVAEVPPARDELEQIVNIHKHAPFTQPLSTKLIHVPLDFLDLMSADKKQQKQLSLGGDIYDVKQLLIGTGIPLSKASIACFFQDRSALFVHTERSNIDLIEKLTDELGLAPPTNYFVNGFILEVDENPLETYDSMSLLKLNPQLIYSFGVALESNRYGSMEATGQTGTIKVNRDEYQLNLSLTFDAHETLGKHDVSIPKDSIISEGRYLRKSNTPGRVYAAILDIDEVIHFQEY